LSRALPGGPLGGENLVDPEGFQGRDAFDFDLNAYVSKGIESLTVRTLKPAVLNWQRKSLHMDCQMFRIPTSRAKPRIVAFRPIKAILQNKYFAEFERTLQFFDSFLGAALFSRQVSDFSLQFYDPAIEVYVTGFFY
jgi:hypothetical protein